VTHSLGPLEFRIVYAQTNLPASSASSHVANPLWPVIRQNIGRRLVGLDGHQTAGCLASDALSTVPRVLGASRQHRPFLNQVG